MKQSERAQKLKGESGFNKYYEALYGERWASLRDALHGEPDYAEYRLDFALEPYYLDSGSIRCAVSFPLNGAKRILDLCAAPGGKTLVLASCMDTDAELLSNERSVDRYNRLVNVCDSCLPESIRKRVHVSCKDGARLCQNPDNQFDRILLDAPCSSERHVLTDSRYLNEWSPSRIRTLAVAQWALLSSAWRMLMPGGYLLYSTCALCLEENDEIIARLIKKFEGAKIMEPVVANDITPFCSAKLPGCEKTEYGMHVLPDKQGGAGPLYFSLIQKC